MDKKYFLLWIKAALIRALRTFAQAAVALIPAGITIAAVDWKVVVGSAALAAVISILTSIGGLPEVEMEVKATKVADDEEDDEDEEEYEEDMSDEV